MAKQVRQVACPKCNRKQPYRSADSIYFCDECRMQFDDSPDEGGTYFSDPSRRMELEDERRAQKQQRTKARFSGR